MWLDSIYFKNSAILFALLLIPVLIALYILFFSKEKPVLQFPNIFFFQKSIKKTIRQKSYHALFLLRLLALSAIIISLARPQTKMGKEEISIEGIDIMLAIDVSTSMLTADFQPNRLEAAKEVAAQFIDNRINDRIGIVIFAGETFTLCPLTTDQNILLASVKEIRNGILQDGTALGDGLATAINRIKDSETLNKTIILLTDGKNNSGFIDPLTAAELAKLYKIRLYVIGVDNIEVRENEPLMRRMANLTNGGTYFRATNEKALGQIFSDIDRMEKSKIDISKYDRTKEASLPFLIFALICISVEIFLRVFYFKTMP